MHVEYFVSPVFKYMYDVYIYVYIYMYDVYIYVYIIHIFNTYMTFYPAKSVICTQT